MDKRSTQMSLPLNVEPAQIKDNIKQHWNITFSRQGKMSVVAKRMMAIVLGQIHENDMQLKPYYQMRAADIVRSTEGGSAYEQCKTAFIELASAVWLIEDIQAQEFEPRNILDTTKTEKKDGFKTAYKDGVITIAVNPALEPYFVQMAHYTRYELANYMKFKSWYSMRLWEILSAYKDTGKWQVPLDEFRRLMDCEKKYPSTKDLIQKTLAEPLQELKGTDLEFTFEKVFNKFSGRGRPGVVGLEFHLVKKASSAEDLLTDWKAYSPEYRQLIERLLGFKVKPRNITKYAKEMGVKGVAKLLTDWQKKMLTNDPIKDKERYCNKAFCDAGKAAMGEEEAS